MPARGVASHIQTYSSHTPGLAVENLTARGLFVRTARPLPVGTPIQVQIVRPGLKRAIQATGRVVSAITAADASARHVVAGMGIVLDDVDLDTQRRLDALVADLAALSAAPPSRRAEASAASCDDLADAKRQIAVRDARIAELERELDVLRRAFHGA